MLYLLAFVSGYAVTLTGLYYVDLRHRGFLGDGDDQ